MTSSRRSRARATKSVPSTHSEIELSDLDSVSNCLKELEPQFIVNTAAMHHVENCEREPQKAFAVNGIGAENLALVARDTGVDSHARKHRLRLRRSETQPLRRSRMLPGP